MVYGFSFYHVAGENRELKISANLASESLTEEPGDFFYTCMSTI